MTDTIKDDFKDLVAILTVGLFLAAIHFLVPSGVQEQLAFDHTRFAPWTLFTAAYSHNSTLHLLGNLLGFGVGAGVAYGLCDMQDRHRWFWGTTAIYLLVLPVLVNLTSYAAFQALGFATTSRGFSGVVAGYTGFVLVALVRWLAAQHDRELALHTGTAILLVLLGEVLVIYVGVPSLTTGALLVAGLALTLGPIGWQGFQRAWTEEERRMVIVEAGFVTGLTILLVVFISMLFPATLNKGTSTTNIIAHGAGFLWGILLATTTGLALR